VAPFITSKVDVIGLDVSEYISTDNMIVNRGGIVDAEKLPSVGRVNKFQIGDTLFSNIRPYFKKVWRARFDGGASNDVLIFRSIDSDILDPLFLYYYISSDKFIDFTVKTAKGVKMPRGDKDAIKAESIYLPSLVEQKRIVAVLECLDEKIELLREQNETLEDMAQLLFKRWFVDFNFPDENGKPYKDAGGKMVESELGEIPEGWKIGSIEDLTIKMNSGGTPSTKNAEYYGGSLNWFSTKEFKDNFVFDSEKKITHKGLSNSSAKLFPEGTVLMAIYASPTVGRLAILSKESTFNQAAVGLIANLNVAGYGYIYLQLKKLRDELNNLANGAAQQNLNVGLVKRFPIVIPKKSVMQSCEPTISSLFEKIKTNSEEIRSLKRVRDLLLPKLISGEIGL